MRRLGPPRAAPVCVGAAKPPPSRYYHYLLLFSVSLCLSLCLSLSLSLSLSRPFPFVCATPEEETRSLAHRALAVRTRTEPPARGSCQHARRHGQRPRQPPTAGSGPVLCGAHRRRPRRRAC